MRQRSNTIRAVCALAAGAAAAAAAGPAAASGFLVQEQSVKGLGRAYSGEAADMGADSLWWNPAAIAGIDQSEAYVGLHGVLADARVTDAGSTIQRPFLPPLPVGGDASVDPVSGGAVPNLAAAWRLNERWSLGLAVTEPFAFRVGNPADAWTRHQALDLRLIDVSVQPTLAWRPARWLGVGVGLDARYADLRLVAARPNLSPLAPDAVSAFNGSGWDIGWTVGAQLHLPGRLTLGASHRSRIDHNLEGRLAVTGLLGPLAAGNADSAAEAAMITPAITTLAARWRASERWTLNGQLQRTGWGDFDTIAVTYAGVTPVVPLTLARDVTSIAVGVEYRPDQRLVLRAGVQHDPQAILDSAILSDSRRMIYSLGASYRPTHRITLDLAAAYVDIKTTQFTSNATAYGGTPLVTPIALTGTFAGKVPILAAGLRVSF